MAGNEVAMKIFKRSLEIILLMSTIAVLLVGSSCSLRIQTPWSRKVKWMKPAEAEKIKIIKIERSKRSPKILIATVKNESRWEVTGFDITVIITDSRGNETEDKLHYVDLEKSGKLGREGLKPGKEVKVKIEMEKEYPSGATFRFQVKNARGFTPTKIKKKNSSIPSLVFPI